MDVESKKQLGSIRGKTWILFSMFLAAAFFADSHVKYDFEQEKEIRRLIKRNMYLKQKISMYHYEIKSLKREQEVCLSP